MDIKVLTQYPIKSNVEVYEKHKKDPTISGKYVSMNDLASSGLSSNIHINIYKSGVLSQPLNVSYPINATVNVYSGGKTSNCVFTNHTVVNVLRGGVMQLDTIGGENTSSETVEGEHTLVSNYTSSNTIIDGSTAENIKLAVTDTHSSCTVMSIPNQNAAAVVNVYNGGSAHGQTLRTNGRMNVLSGGAGINVSMYDNAVLDVSKDGTVMNVKFYHSGNNVATNKTYVNTSDVYGVPVSGHQLEDGTVAWYISYGTGFVQSNISATITDTDKRTATIVFSSSVLSGTYKLNLTNSALRDTVLSQAKEAIWLNTNTSDVNHYTCIERGIISGAYAWLVNQIDKSYVSGVETVSKTTLGYALDRVDVSSAGVSYICPNAKVYINDGAAQISGGANADITVGEYGVCILNRGTVAPFAITTHKYAMLTCSSATSDMKFNLNVPGDSRVKDKVYAGSDVLFSNLVLPSISIFFSGSLERISVSRNLISSSVIPYDTTVTVHSGGIAREVDVFSSGKMLVMSGAVATSCSVNRDGIVQIDPLGSANSLNVGSNGSAIIAASARGNVSCTEQDSCFVDITYGKDTVGMLYNFNSDVSRTLGYEASNILTTWSSIYQSNTVALTADGDSTIQYSVTYNGSQYLGSMVRQSDTELIYKENEANHFCIRDTDSSLKLVKYDSNWTLFDVIAEKQETHSNYAVHEPGVQTSLDNASMVIRIPDKVQVSKISTTSGSTVVGMSGTTDISNIENNESCYVTMIGYSAANGIHYPSVENLTGSNPVNFSIGQYCVVSSIHPNDNTGEGIFSVGLSGALGASLVCTTSSSYQMLSTALSNNIPVSATAAGLIVTPNNTVNVGANALGVGLRVTSASVNLTADGTLMAPYLSSGEINMLPGGNLLQAVNLSSGVVSATSSAVVRPFGNDRLVLYQSGTSKATLIKGICNAASITANTIYVLSGEPMVGAGSRVTSSPSIADDVFWFDATNGYILNRNGSGYYIRKGNVTSDGNYLVFTKTADVANWVPANTSNGYSLHSAYRDPLGVTRVTTAKSRGYRNFAAYTNGCVLHAESSVHTPKYIITDKTFVEGAVTGDHIGLDIDTYRFETDSEGVTSSAPYYHTGDWSNNGSMFYDSGVVVTSNSYVFVKQKVLHNATVVGGGTLQVGSSGYVRNLSQKKNGALAYWFDNGGFHIDGHCFIRDIDLTGDLDNYVWVNGSSLIGTTTRAMLSMVDVFASGDNRVWSGDLVNLAGAVTRTKHISMYCESSTWKIKYTDNSAYTEPVDTFNEFISAGSAVSSFLPNTLWYGGMLSFSGDQLKIVSTAIGSMYGITSSDGSYVVPESANVPSSMIAVMPTSAMFVVSGGNYVLGAIDAFMYAYRYDSGDNSYHLFDSMASAMIPGETTSTVSLEDTGKHTADPWWISGRYSEYNTLNPSVFTGTQSIMRVNTRTFDICDLTSNYTYHKLNSGGTIENVASTVNNFITYSDVYAPGGTLTIGDAGCVSKCSTNIATINVNQGGILDNLYTVGNADGIVVNFNALNKLTYVNDITLYRKASAVIGSLCDGFRYSSSVELNKGDSTIHALVPKYPINAEGDRSLYTIFSISDPKFLVNYNGLLHQYTSASLTGYFVGHYIEGSTILTHGYGTKAQWNNFYTERYNQLSNYNHSANAHLPATGNWGYQNRGKFKQTAVGMVVENDSSVLSCGRHEIMLDLDIEDGVYDPTTSTLTNHTVTCTDAVWLHPEVWVTPRLKVLRTDYTNYCTNTPLIALSDYTSTGASNCDAVNSKFYSAPNYTAADTTPIANAPAYQIYSSTAMTDGAIISSCIAHVKPGAILKQPVLKPEGGIFVDSCAMAMDIDVTNVATSAETYKSLNEGYTHRVEVEALRGGTVIIKAGVSMNETVGAEANAAAQVAIANGKRNGFVCYGLTRSYTGDAPVVELPSSAATWCNPIELASKAATEQYCIYSGDTTKNGTTFGLCVYKELYVGGSFNNTSHTSSFELIGSASTGRKSLTIDGNNGASFVRPVMLYIGSNATIHCNKINVYDSCVCIIESGATLDITSMKIGSGMNDTCKLVVMNGSAIDFNAKAKTFTLQDTAFVAGREYYTRAGTGAFGSPFVYTSADITGVPFESNKYFYATYGGNKYRIYGHTEVNIMSNFTLSNMPRRSIGYPVISGSCIMPSSFIAQSGYDVHAVNNGKGVTFTSAEGSNTVVSGVTYPVYKGAAQGQALTMSYAENITDPSTGTVFNGWAIDGYYEPAPGVTSSGILYAVSSVTPCSYNWIKINGRFFTPVVDGFITDYYYATFNDCSYTDVTTLYNDIVDGDYVDIIHVNGKLNGVVSGHPHLGNAAVITTNTSLSSDGYFYWHDLSIREPHIPVTLDGTVIFRGDSVMDYASSAVIKVISSGSNDAAFVASEYVPELTSTISYKFWADKTDQPLFVRKYTITEDIPVSADSRVQYLNPFIMKRCTISGTNTWEMICANMLSHTICSNAKVGIVDRATHTEMNGGTLTVSGSAFSVRLNSGASGVISGYARNIIVSSGAVLNVVGLKSDAKATVDNIKVLSGGSALISGYVTGFEMEDGADVSAVDSRYVRTSKFYQDDYNWS